jgi:hypothetical protein
MKWDLAFIEGKGIQLFYIHGYFFGSKNFYGQVAIAPLLKQSYEKFPSNFKAVE